MDPDPDDVTYKKNVKTMAVILAVMLAVVVAAVVVPPYIFPPTSGFQSSVSLPSLEGFNLDLTLNSTQVSPGGAVNITASAVSTDAAINNVTAQDTWGVDSSSLWASACYMPVAVGIMKGDYGSDNYTQGTLLEVGSGAVSCSPPAPTYFAFEPRTSTALVAIDGKPEFWTIRTSYVFSSKDLEGTPAGATTVSGGGLAPGVYTVIAADEWGDVLLTNFQVT